MPCERMAPTAVSDESVVRAIAAEKASKCASDHASGESLCGHQRSEAMERGEDGCQTGHEAVIEVNAPQELLQFVLGGWTHHANNVLHLGGKWDHASFGDSVAKELDGGRVEDALLLVDRRPAPWRIPKMCSKCPAWSSGVGLATNISSR